MTTIEVRPLLNRNNLAPVFWKEPPILCRWAEPWSPTLSLKGRRAGLKSSSWVLQTMYFCEWFSLTWAIFALSVRFFFSDLYGGNIIKSHEIYIYIFFTRVVLKALCLYILSIIFNTFIKVLGNRCYRSVVIFLKVRKL